MRPGGAEKYECPTNAVSRHIDVLGRDEQGGSEMGRTNTAGSLEQQPTADVLLWTFQVVLRRTSWQMVEHCQLQHSLNVRNLGLQEIP